MVKRSVKGAVVGGVLLVAIGALLVFGGFELMAYELTVDDREVERNGTVTDLTVEQLPDGNYTHRIAYEYTFDQEAEITRQGIEEEYPYEMNGERTYENSETKGKYESRSEARGKLDDRPQPDETVTVYVDPYFPGEGSLSPVRSPMPRILQYGGTLLTLGGLLVLWRLARRVSA